MKRVVILGSTGSIGTQTLDVIRAFPDQFRVLGLAAGSNLDLLASQIREFEPRYYGSGSGQAPAGCAGCLSASLLDMATLEDADLIVAAMSGDAALWPTVAALDAGKTVALANKELIVMAGEHLKRAADQGGGRILPVDSEPSAIWQCLRGEDQPVRRLIITASGGAFRDRSWEELRSVSPAEALRHPTWRMGPKVTIDSATLVNKALEVVEAHFLFDVPYEQIEVLVHRESIVHSLVEFQDGSIKAQMGPPDMRFPIQYALTYPRRLCNPRASEFSLADAGALTFEPLQHDQYPCFGLALRTAQRGGTWRAALVGADDAAVGLFLEGRIRFTEIGTVIEEALAEHRPVMNPSLEEIAASASETARRVRSRAAVLEDA